MMEAFRNGLIKLRDSPSELRRRSCIANAEIEVVHLGIRSHKPAFLDEHLMLKQKSATQDSPFLFLCLCLGIVVSMLRTGIALTLFVSFGVREVIAQSLDDNFILSDFGFKFVDAQLRILQHLDSDSGVGQPKCNCIDEL